MKSQLAKLAAVLLLLITGLGAGAQTVVYTSPNAGADGSRVEDMIHLNFRDVYDLNADLEGGIIGQVQSGGSIVLEVFEYDPGRTQGTGDLLYKKKTNSNTTTYGGTAEQVTITDKFGLIRVSSDNIKAMGQAGSIYATNGSYSCLPPGFDLLSTVMKEGFDSATEECEYVQRNQPVIIKVTQSNAVASRVKIPGIGIYDIPKKDHRPFAVYNGTIGYVVTAAHRGSWESPQVPENTRAALGAALNNNADMIELDIALSSDGVPVIFHDSGLNKRTTLSGAINGVSFSQLNGLPIRNRFDEVPPAGNTTTLISLADALDFFQNDLKKTFLNLDKSANDMATFKKIYQIVKDKGMLDRCIFKGRFVPASNDPADKNLPTVAGFRQAFAEMFPSSSVSEREEMIQDMYFTPVLFDDFNVTADDALAAKYFSYMNGFVQAAFADGFELNFKALPVGSSAFYCIDNNSRIVLLRRWAVLGSKNFVEWVHSFRLPVGIFASEPEVGAVPQYTGSPTSRDPNNLVSGTVFEVNFLPVVTDQPVYDFRGNPDFYINAGADYVITDRPDQLLAYLTAIRRNKH